MTEEKFNALKIILANFSVEQAMQLLDHLRDDANAAEAVAIVRAFLNPAVVATLDTMKVAYDILKED